MSLAPSRGRRRSRRRSTSLSSAFGDGESDDAAASYSLANVALLLAGMVFATSGVFITLVTLEPVVAGLFLLALVAVAGVLGVLRVRGTPTRSRSVPSGSALRTRLSNLQLTIADDAPDRL